MLPRMILVIKWNRGLTNKNELHMGYYFHINIQIRSNIMFFVLIRVWYFRNLIIIVLSKYTWFRTHARLVLYAYGGTSSLRKWILQYYLIQPMTEDILFIKFMMKSSVSLSEHYRSGLHMLMQYSYKHPFFSGKN